MLVYSNAANILLYKAFYQSSFTLVMSPNPLQTRCWLVASCIIMLHQQERRPYYFTVTLFIVLYYRGELHCRLLSIIILHLFELNYTIYCVLYVMYVIYNIYSIYYLLYYISIIHDNTILIIIYHSILQIYILYEYYNVKLAVKSIQYVRRRVSTKLLGLHHGDLTSADARNNIVVSMTFNTGLFHLQQFYIYYRIYIILYT